MFGSLDPFHGLYFFRDPGLLWLHVVSDLLIALSYLLIPIVLFQIVRRRGDIRFNPIFLCFAAFILACGVTHIIEVVSFWHPIYWVSGILKAVTAAISLMTFFFLWRITPALLAIPREQQLKEANHRLNSVLESTVVGVLAVDSDWRINYLNGSAKSVLKIDNNLIGTSMWAAFPGQAPETRETLKQVMATRQPIIYESHYPPLDLFTMVKVHPWENGGITLFFTDISEQKRLQRELDKERVRREQRIEALGHMAGGLAHEISNPLGIIYARACDLAEVAAENPAVPSRDVSVACASIIRTSDRAMRILRGLRMFAREGSRDPMQPAQIDTLIEQTVDLVRTRYQVHGIVLDVSIPPNLPPLQCREVQISQIVLNLLNNAFDAIDSVPASRRWVSVEASIQSSIDTDSDHLCIDVLDGGPGVPKEHRSRLMDTFFTTKSIGGGMGIGLSLCRAIAQDHGGSLDLVDSKEYTCFRLKLPLQPVLQNGVAA